MNQLDHLPVHHHFQTMTKKLQDLSSVRDVAAVIHKEALVPDQHQESQREEEERKNLIKRTKKDQKIKQNEKESVALKHKTT